MGKIDIPNIIYQEITNLFPQARCELNYRKDYELLIAIILSAQTTDVSVNKITEKLFKKYLSINDFVNVKLIDLESDIKNIGLFRNKSKNIKKMAEIVVNKYDSRIPKTQEELESLPGVGRKTANVFLSEFYHVPRIAVDTHVSRVSIRLGLANRNDSPRKIEQNLMKLYDETLWIDLHHKLIFFGRYYCKAKKPMCETCPLIKYCKFPSL